MALEDRLKALEADVAILRELFKDELEPVNEGDAPGESKNAIRLHIGNCVNMMGAMALDDTEKAEERMPLYAARQSTP